MWKLVKLLRYGQYFLMIFSLDSIQLLLDVVLNITSYI